MSNQAGRYWQEITPGNAGEILKRIGAIAPDARVEAAPLGGGVSNIVLKVTAAGRRYVVKQALPQLRVQDEWLAEQSRIWREADALRALGQILPQGQIPDLVAEDRGQYLLVMSCAPDTARAWKAQLMDGTVETAVAAEVGQMLGLIHARTAGDADMQARFGDLKAFDQLRVDPYYRTSAARHPDVGEELLAAGEALLRSPLALVHGDFSPKNILVDEATPVPTLTLLDFEVIHFGDPAFDAAFCLNHLFLKALHFRPHSAPYLAAAQALWSAYLAQLPPQLAASIEPRTVRQLGCLLLARIDGKSPAEYITAEETRETVRGVSKTILKAGLCELSQVFQLVSKEPRTEH